MTDLVSTARKEFDKLLGKRPNQRDRLRDEVNIAASDLQNFHIPGGEITEEGLRLNINVGVQYIESWLRGTGAAAINNLMEDAATAEISRAQIWQWIHHPNAKLPDGRNITSELYKEFLGQELERIKQMWGMDLFAKGKFKLAAELLNRLVTNDTFAEFLTLMAYKEL